MRFFYSIGIFFYAFVARIIALRSPKAKQWVKGRKESFDKLVDFAVGNKNPVAWFHAASLGEFEQGRPIIEKIKKEHPEYKILLTFFSPSGYEIRRNYEHADCVIYLPNDTPANAKFFLNVIQPEFVVFIKYEYWYNYLKQLRLKNIKTFYISAIFRNSQYFFKPYGSWFRKQLKSINHFFVQDENSAKLLKKIGIEQVTVSGDTRFDRVIEIAENHKEIPHIRAFKGNQKLFVAGSSWTPDEELIEPLVSKLKTDFKFLIVPHDISTNHLDKLDKLFPEAIRYSTIKENQDLNLVSTIIVDKIGYLSQLYQYADIAYIGGGFGKGIHNTLEAAVFHIPVIFGPNYKKFQEAHDLIGLGIASVITNSVDLEKIIGKITADNAYLTAVSETSKAYFDKQKGATRIILNKLFEN